MGTVNENDFILKRQNMLNLNTAIICVYMQIQKQAVLHVHEFTVINCGGFICIYLL